VLIAFLDADDQHHASARTAMSELRTGVAEVAISAVTYSEALVGAYRRGTQMIVESLLARFPITAYAVTAEVADHAARLRAQRKWLRLPDALILATAAVLNAETVVTADARWRRVTSRARVIRG